MMLGHNNARLDRPRKTWSSPPSADFLVYGHLALIDRIHRIADLLSDGAIAAWETDGRTDDGEMRTLEVRGLGQINHEQRIDSEGLPRPTDCMRRRLLPRASVQTIKRIVGARCFPWLCRQIHSCIPRRNQSLDRTGGLTKHKASRHSQPANASSWARYASLRLRGSQLASKALRASWTISACERPTSCCTTSRFSVM
jgi:hypothetical protein